MLISSAYVWVRAYFRFRFGKREHVRAHTRSWPSK